jgi:hypothetical protein
VEPGKKNFIATFCGEAKIVEAIESIEESIERDSEKGI